MTWAEKLADLVSRERSDFGRPGLSKYLTRWTLLGARYDSTFLGGRAVFLHRFHRSDADEMHNHPWPFVSIILGGGYWEKTPAYGWLNGDGPTRVRWYAPGRVLVRPANWVHSVIVPPGREAWTLILRGVKAQSWGFFCPRVGYVPWRQHEANAKATGFGCGEG